MKEFIIKTAWPMVPPRPYSAFHICIMAAGFLAAVLAAYFLSRKTERKFFIRLLFSAALSWPQARFTSSCSCITW